jgi:ubiquitin-activating enzyme E1
MAASSETVLSEAEKLRMDRQLHALGETMVKRMKNARVLLCGLGGLGVEIAKNVALAGVKQLTLSDSKLATKFDLTTQFYLSSASLGKNRASESLSSLDELNPFCPVDVADQDVLEMESGEALDEFVARYSVVVLTEAGHEEQVRVNDACHRRNVAFLAADVRGVFCSAFADFGGAHEVWDDNGEQPAEVLLSDVAVNESGDGATITCLQFHKCPLEEGQHVVLKELRGALGDALGVRGDDDAERVYKVTATRYSSDTKTGSFDVALDASAAKGAAFEVGSGRALQRKVAVRHAYEPLSALHDAPPFDKLLLSDFAKFGNPAQLHVAFAALREFEATEKRAPQPWHSGDADALVALAGRLNAERFASLVDDVDEPLVRALSHTARGAISPLMGFMGGFISQEVLKAVSGKFLPLNQFFYLDAVEVLPDDASAVKYVESDDRDAAQIACLGAEMNDRLARARLFTVGAGAIGCELLKNYAMMGVATRGDGEVAITDDDHIELSNLNRQFLFRESDIGSAKSASAAVAVRRMNPAIRIVAHEKRVEPKSEDVFSNRYLESVDCVVNALDNVKARLYVDSRCVENQRPLIESGTLSSMGHVQVIVPFLTEHYGAQADPASNDVPFCTIKSFPHDINHCIEWARDLCFEKQFAAYPNRFNKLMAANGGNPSAALAASDGAKYRPDIVVKMLRRRPTTFDECVQLGRVKWEKFFAHSPSDLLHAFPLDHKDPKDGKMFWSSPKRPPRVLAWDSSDTLNLLFVRAYANLLAFNYGVEQCADLARMVAVADAAVVPAWTPKSKKIDTDETKTKSSEAASSSTNDDDDGDEQADGSSKLDDDALREYAKYIESVGADALKPLALVEFEKDDDSNHHIDCLHATANLRARVYAIEEVERMETKRIAGRILPALATTTSCVAGWAMVQLITVLKKPKIDAYKSAFLNLALPSFQFTEPGPSKKIMLAGDVEFDTIWEQWVVRQPDATIQQFLDTIRDEHGFDADSIFQDGMLTVFIGFMHTSRLSDKLIDHLPVPPKDDQDYVLLTVTPEEDESDEDEDEEEQQDGAVVRFYIR